MIGPEAMNDVACGCCGSIISCPHLSGMWAHGESVSCKCCEAINQVAIDTDGEAFCTLWRCVHGMSDEEPCHQCETDAGIAV